MDLPPPSPTLVVPLHTVIPGRARLRVVGLRRSEPLKNLLEAALAGHGAVLAVTANSLTGTLLVVYQPTLALEAVIDLAETVARQQSPWRVVPPAADQVTPNRIRTKTTALQPAQPTPLASDSPPWHRMKIVQILDYWQVSPEIGYSEEAVRRGLQRYGANALPPPNGRSAWETLVGQFVNLPVALLGVSAGVAMATGGLVDAAVILGVMLMNATIGYITERQSERTISSIVARRQTARLVRAGHPGEYPAEQVIPGDLLILTPGSYVCADARLIQSDNLSVDESSLTGESLPVRKSIATLDQEQVPLGDRINMVYMGTTVTGGSGLAVVVATGMTSEIGRIQQLLGDVRTPETPMERQINHLSDRIVWLSGAVCLAVFGVGLLRGYPWMDMLKAAISLAVAAVPEGLPTVATTTLALGIAEMRRQQVLVRQLDAVESLGAVQVICMDKTGTLTENRMSLVEIRPNGQRLRLRRGRFVTPERQPVEAARHPDLQQILATVVLCSDVEQVQQEGGGYQLTGSATEAALVQGALDAGLDLATLHHTHPRLAVAYRAEGRQYMATLHAAAGEARLVAVKGSPKEVLALCSQVQQDGQPWPLDEGLRRAITADNEIMAGDGLRVLGVAYGYLQTDEALEDLADKLVWLGLTGLADPTREGMGELISQLHQAGIDTVMITGDQSATAYAIGKELQLGRNGHLEILDSSHLDQVDPEVLSALAQRVDVFARVSPAHKLQIVQALQRVGKVVAMTGDGINDGPALKAADIGVAMGRNGTDVARNVADVVLEDDNLETLIQGIAQGRTIYGNIRKSLRFLLGTNFSEIVVMLGSIAGGLGTPLNPMQLLWINLVSDIFPGLALAVEPAEPDVMNQPPRDPTEPILRRDDLVRVGIEGTVISVAALGAYGFGIARYGIGPQASTLAFSSLTTAQLLHALTCRSDTHSLYDGRSLPTNNWLRLALGGSLAAQALVLTVPSLRRLLGLAPVAILDLVVAAAGAALPLLVNEALKYSPSLRSVEAPSP